MHMAMKLRLSMMMMVAFGWLLQSGAAEAIEVKVGDRVLALRQATNSYFAATVKTASYEGGSVEFDDGTLQEYGPITFEPSMRAFEWKIGSELECSAAAATTAAVGDEDSPALTRGRVTALDATTVELDSAGTRAKFPLAACRYRRTWWDGVSVVWRSYASYPTLKAIPKKGAKAPAPGEVSAAFDYYLQAADGGSYLQIKKCLTTGKSWSKIMSGGDLVARVIDVACAFALPLPPRPQELFTCLVEYGQCRQEYQGDGVYGGCVWQPVARDPSQIKCGAIK